MTEYPQRKSPRLQGYDYAEEGAYFVTICNQNRASLFGVIVNDSMHCNSAGKMVTDWWICLPSKFVDIELDLHVIMPNHFHGIVVINRHPNAPYHSRLSEVIQWFKVMTTNAYIQGVKSFNWAAFDGKLWQRSFHDHIIRNEHELNLVRQYVESNPAKWAEDTFYG